MPSDSDRLPDGNRPRRRRPPRGGGRPARGWDLTAETGPIRTTGPRPVRSWLWTPRIRRQRPATSNNDLVGLQITRLEFNGTHTIAGNGVSLWDLAVAGTATGDRDGQSAAHAAGRFRIGTLASAQLAVNGTIDLNGLQLGIENFRSCELLGRDQRRRRHPETGHRCTRRSTPRTTSPDRSRSRMGR